MYKNDTGMLHYKMLHQVRSSVSRPGMLDKENKFNFAHPVLILRGIRTRLTKFTVYHSKAGFICVS
jgi:hypothetical protein